MIDRIRISAAASPVSLVIVRYAIFICSAKFLNHSVIYCSRYTYLDTNLSSCHPLNIYHSNCDSSFIQNVIQNVLRPRVAFLMLLLLCFAILFHRP